MHEWALAESVIYSAIKEAERRGAKKILEIVVVLGELQAIDEEILKYALEELKKGTIAEEARIEMCSEEAEFKCRACGYVWKLSESPIREEIRENVHFVPEVVHSFIRCPKCGSRDFEVIKGRGVYIKEIKVVMRMDPRIAGIEEKLSKVKRIIPVFSGKGGVGKSLISTCLALSLRDLGFSVGLFDLDFHGASDHIILGESLEELPGEEKGITPKEVRGIKFMTIAYYSKDFPLPLRGKEITDALIELLSVTVWGDLDFLIIDMPPGLGDPFLDLIRYIPRAEHLGVGTSSKLSKSVLKKCLELLREEGKRILGIVENMAKGGTLRDLAEEFEIRYLGKIPYYEDLDEKIGSDELFSSEFFRRVKEIGQKISSLRRRSLGRSQLLLRLLPRSSRSQLLEY